MEESPGKDLPETGTHSITSGTLMLKARFSPDEENWEDGGLGEDVSVFHEVTREQSC